MGRFVVCGFVVCRLVVCRRAARLSRARARACTAADVRRRPWGVRIAVGVRAGRRTDLRVEAAGDEQVGQHVEGRHRGAVAVVECAYHPLPDSGLQVLQRSLVEALRAHPPRDGFRQVFPLQAVPNLVQRRFDGHARRHNPGLLLRRWQEVLYARPAFVGGMRWDESGALGEPRLEGAAIRPNGARDPACHVHLDVEKFEQIMFLSGA